jgi:DNA recombination protein RmuC
MSLLYPLLLAASAIGLWLWEHFKRRKLELACAIYQEQARRLPELEDRLKEKENEILTLQMQKSAIEEKWRASQQIEQQLTHTFRTLSSDALEKNNRTFLDLAKMTLEKFQEGAKGDLEKRQQAIGELLTPVKEQLGKLDSGLRQLEKERKGEHETLKEQVRTLLESENKLRQETSNLVRALRAPIHRGRWGEMQLRRVVELAGMLDHCDFSEQCHAIGEDEETMRPDLVVHLPGGRQVIVDAKAPLEAYLEALETSDEKHKEQKLKDHARQVRTHVTLLSKKAYWENFHPTPEFVVLFLPSETFFSAALEHDPSLIEVGAGHRVILATPTTLIALLHAVAYGWKQENLTLHAEKVNALGHELYKRLVDMGSHWMKMGRSLSTAVESYNKAVGSLETRVLVTARKFKELGAASASDELDTLEVVEREPRLVQASEMQE